MTAQNFPLNMVVPFKKLFQNCQLEAKFQKPSAFLIFNKGFAAVMLTKLSKGPELQIIV